MQLNSVYLYPNKIDVFTNTLASWPTERYRRVYNRNLKLYRGVDNKIDLQVRNSDEKSANITGSTLVFNLVTRDTKDLIMSRDCTTQSNTSGRVYVTITDDDLLDLESGFYNFTVTQEVREYIDVTEYRVTSRIPLYIDSQYGAIATLEILGDVYGETVNSLLVDKFNYTNPFTTGDSTPSFYISSIIDTHPEIGPVNGLHTFQFYLTNYSGQLIVQGSLEEQGASPRESKWVDVDTLTLTNADTQYLNITGKYNWFRIKHIPTTSNTGTVDKVLYR